jgi:hypothetical protein
MTVQKPRPRYGYRPGDIQIGSRVRYVRLKDTPSNAPDEDYSLRDMIFDPGPITGEITDGPDTEEGLELWEVEWQGVWMPDGVAVDIWWTYTSIMELA